MGNCLAAWPVHDATVLQFSSLIEKRKNGELLQL